MRIAAMKTRGRNPAHKKASQTPDLRQRLTDGLHHLQETSDATSFVEDERQEGDTEGLSREALEIAASLDDDGISVPVLTGSVRAIDMGLILLSAVAASHTVAGATTLGLAHFIAMGISVVFAFAFFQASDTYQVSVMGRGMSQIGRVAASWTMVFVMLAVIRFTTGFGADISLQWAGGWFVSSLAGLICVRLVVSALVRRWRTNGRLERRAIIVGGGTAAAELIHDLETQADSDIRICGIFDDRAQKKKSNTLLRSS